MYNIYMYINNKQHLSRETNNRQVALRVYKNYVACTQYIQHNNIIVLLYYNNKRLKTFKKGLDKSTKV